MKKLIFSVLMIILLIGFLGCTACKPEEGARAFHAGVPANANPYVGVNEFSAKYWLDGWIAEAEKAGQNK